MNESPALGNNRDVKNEIIAVRRFMPFPPWIVDILGKKCEINFRDKLRVQEDATMTTAALA
jgi:hypothetical protein